MTNLKYPAVLFGLAICSLLALIGAGSPGSGVPMTSDVPQVAGSGVAEGALQASLSAPPLSLDNLRQAGTGVFDARREVAAISLAEHTYPFLWAPPLTRVAWARTVNRPIDDYGNTQLHMAARSAAPFAVWWLTSVGASAEVMNEGHQTPYDLLECYDAQQFDRMWAGLDRTLQRNAASIPTSGIQQPTPDHSGEVQESSDETDSEITVVIDATVVTQETQRPAFPDFFTDPDAASPLPILLLNHYDNWMAAGATTIIVY